LRITQRSITGKVPNLQQFERHEIITVRNKTSISQDRDFISAGRG
jgi:hypothetical protein